MRVGLFVTRNTSYYLTSTFGVKYIPFYRGTNGRLIITPAGAATNLDGSSLTAQGPQEQTLTQAEGVFREHSPVHYEGKMVEEADRTGGMPNLLWNERSPKECPLGEEYSPLVLVIAADTESTQHRHNDNHFHVAY